MQNFEMQGFTWQAKRKYQQDAILFHHQVISNKQQATTLCQFSASEAWQIAVADGVGSKINSDLAAISILELLEQHVESHHNDPALSTLQTQLAKHLSANDIDKASTTLASITYQPNHDGAVNLQSLGDSRIYYFSAQNQLWQCLTQDDILGNQIKFSVLDAKKELGSRYYALTGFFSADAKHQVKDKAPIRHILQPNDALLVCSDGVYNALCASDWPLLQAHDHLTDWIKAFAKQLAVKAHDNLSFIIVRCIDRP